MPGHNGGAGGRPQGIKDTQKRERRRETQEEKEAKKRRKEQENKKSLQQGLQNMQAALQGQGRRPGHSQAIPPAGEGQGQGEGSTRGVVSETPNCYVVSDIVNTDL